MDFKKHFKKAKSLTLAFLAAVGMTSVGGCVTGDYNYGYPQGYINYPTTTWNPHTGASSTYYGGNNGYFGGNGYNVPPVIHRYYNNPPQVINRYIQQPPVIVQQPRPHLPRNWQQHRNDHRGGSWSGTRGPRDHRGDHPGRR